MPEKKVTIGLIQTSVSKDLDLNLKRTMEYVKSAAAKGAQIVCLQELFRTRYFPQWDQKDARALAETIPGPSTEAFSKLAEEQSIVVIVPVFEKDEAGYYNSVAVIDADGRLLPTYRKLHIPNDPLFYEQSYFTPGEEIRVYDTRYAKIAVLICYDQWFPEAARVAALGGAEVIFYPTAIGWIKGEEDPAEGDWHDAWETIQRSHSIASSVCVAAANRVGLEGDIVFWGSSFVCDCFGKILARASSSKEEMLVVELDLGHNEVVRESWGFFRNRRPDVYWPIIEMVQEKKKPERKAKEGPSLQDTPRSLGYRMPAEWEKHEAIWLSWPYDPGSFPEIEAVEDAYSAIIKVIHQSETVNLLVKDEMMQSAVAGRLKSEKVDLRRVRFHLVSYVDVWFRDYGPTFVVNGKMGAGKEVAVVNWIFNAWGRSMRSLWMTQELPASSTTTLIWSASYQASSWRAAPSM